MKKTKGKVWTSEIYGRRDNAEQRADEIRGRLSTLQSVRIYERVVRVDGERLLAYVLIARVNP